ncbi:MAG TPA: hypothetical protein VGP13_03140 [Candidatus Paceibacterota bacterium]|jgi:hypothetical protein|nr:hypothetical protein [Candidatus Paceibacterota bacterium]
MTVKMIFNTDKKLKEAAMRKARKDGLTYSAVLNIATRAYVNDQMKIAAFDRDIEIAMEQFHQGKGVPSKEVYRRLGLRK